MNNIFQNYQKGMAAFDNCHSSTVQSQWVALKDEIGEFVQEPNLNEIWDIVHAAGRLLYKLIGIPLYLLARNYIPMSRFKKHCYFRKSPNPAPVTNPQSKI